jgi:thiol reductant ABC exporter CydC subunit
MTAADRLALRRVIAIAPPARRTAVAAVLCAVAAVLAATALLAVSGALISKAALRPPVLSLGVLIVLVRGLALTRALARYGERLASHDTAFRALARLRTAFFARLAERRPVVPGLPHTDLLSRFVADVDRLQDLYLRALAPPVVAVLTAVLATFGVALVLPAAAAVLLAGLLVAGIAVPWATAALAQQASRRQAAARATLSTGVLEVTRHGAELAVLGQSGARMQRLHAADRALARLARRDALAGALATAGTGLAQGGAIVGVLLVAVPATADGRIDGILLAALVLLTFGAFEAVAGLPAAAVSLSTCASAAGRLTAVSEAPAGVVDSPCPAPLPWSTGLELRGVRLQPGPAGPAVLDGVSLKTRPGECIAIVGPSGAGKTLLAELLVRFRDPDAGSVLLGGTDVRRLSVRDLRSTVRLIAEETGLFTTSLAENVRLARPGAGDDEVRGALEAAGLGPWLATLPAGLATILGEDGGSVSGGQRRRIAVARAFLAVSPVLVVDEPTTHLDPDGAQALLDGLCAHARDRSATLIVIVHPGCDLSGFDRVLELRGGRLHAAHDRSR